MSPPFRSTKLHFLSIPNVSGFYTELRLVGDITRGHTAGRPGWPKPRLLQHNDPRPPHCVSRENQEHSKVQYEAK